MRATKVIKLNFEFFKEAKNAIKAAAFGTHEEVRQHFERMQEIEAELKDLKRRK